MQAWRRGVRTGVTNGLLVVYLNGAWDAPDLPSLKGSMLPQVSVNVSLVDDSEVRKAHRSLK